VALTGLVSVTSVLAGLYLSSAYDVPGGPAIVLVMALLASGSLAVAALRANG
jgi:ABC-type Mn2+/Zn2+ transport system permease subunit